MIKRKRKHPNTIISGRKFTGTLATDDYQIKDIDIVADARYSYGLIIKIRVYTSNPNFEKYKRETSYYSISEASGMAVKLNLSCQSHNKDRLEGKDFRFIRRRTFPGGVVRVAL